MSDKSLVSLYAKACQFYKDIDKLTTERRKIGRPSAMGTSDEEKNHYNMLLKETQGLFPDDPIISKMKNASLEEWVTIDTLLIWCGQLKATLEAHITEPEVKEVHRRIGF